MSKTLGKIFSKPENLFLLIAIIFGTLVVIITPPFQAADEDTHFFRAFQVAEGSIIEQRQGGLLGGLLPRNLEITVRNVSKGVAFHQENKQKMEDTLAYLNMPLNPEDKVFVNFPGGVMYSPIPYLPQVLGILSGKMLGLSPLLIMYLARMFNLVVWVLFLFCSIKILPVMKWLMFMLALAPMSVFQSASLSADGFTNGISFLVFSLFLYYSFGSSTKITLPGIATMLALSMLLALSKATYLPVIFLFLLVPFAKLETGKRYFFIFFLMVVADIVAAAGWAFMVKDLQAFSVSTAPIPNVSPEAQIKTTLEDPFRVIRVISDTLQSQWKVIVQQYIGQLGWVDTPLPDWYRLTYGIMLGSIALTGGVKSICISWKAKILSSLLCLSCFVLVATFLYLSWTPVGAYVILGIQGRYLIPLGPLFFMLVYNNNRRLNIRQNALGLIVVGYSVFSIVVTLFVLVNRYYVQ